VIEFCIKVGDRLGNPINGAVVTLRKKRPDTPIEGTSPEKTDSYGLANFSLPNIFGEMKVEVWVDAQGPNDPQLAQEMVLGKKIFIPVTYRV